MARQKLSQVVIFERGGSIHLRTNVAIAALTDAEGPARSWVQLFTIGSFKKGTQKFSITPAMLTEMVTNFTEGLHPVPPTELCIDYEHLSSVATDNPEAGKAAGWIKDLETRVDGEELWALVEWTPAASDRIKAKEYKLLSPEFAFNFTTPTMEAIGCTLLAAAITNRPFLQGMEPITLTTRSKGDVALLVDLSYDQRRGLVERALRARSRAAGSSYDWPYICALYDASVVYEAGGGQNKYLRESYALDADGTVTLGEDAAEVVATWDTLGAAALRQPGENDMKAITLKSTDGKDVQIPEEAVESLAVVKDLRAQLADRVPKADVAKLQAENVTLTGKVDAIQATLLERDADGAIETLVATGKASAGQRESLKALYLKDKSLFDSVTAGFTPRVTTGEVGHGGPAVTGEGGAVAQVNASVVALRTADPKLTVEAALEQVFAKDATLYPRYVKESEQKVGKVS